MNLALTYMQDGLDPIQTLYKRKRVSWPEVRDCLSSLVKAKVPDLEPFQDWAKEIAPARGRAAPVPGSSSVYKVRNVAGFPYVQVPVQALGLEPGQKVRITFAADSVLVQVCTRPGGGS